MAKQILLGIRERKKAICKIADYVPNGLIPEADDCGDYIRLRDRKSIDSQCIRRVCGRR